MQTPYHDEAAFDESKERLRLQNYRDDLYWQKLKQSFWCAQINRLKLTCLTDDCRRRFNAAP